MSQRDGTRASAQQEDDVELPAAGIWLVWKLVCCADANGVWLHLPEEPAFWCSAEELAKLTIN